MEEQSIGESYALNHLVDTSFAGSAMRTIEGVWMSVTPTEKALAVAMRFYGLSLSNSVAKRLKCVKVIPLGATKHKGSHNHSLDKVIHFCGAR